MAASKKHERVYAWDHREHDYLTIIEGEIIVGEVISECIDTTGSVRVKSVIDGNTYVIATKDLYRVGTGPVRARDEHMKKELSERRLSAPTPELYEAYTLVLRDLGTPDY